MANDFVIPAILAVAIGIVAVASWVAILIYGVKAVMRRKPGVNLWGGETLWNPANVLIRPELLTDEGLRYRRNCFIAIGVFVALIAGVMLYGISISEVKTSNNTFQRSVMQRGRTVLAMDCALAGAQWRQCSAAELGR